MPSQVYKERWEVDRSLGEGGQAHTFLVKDLQENDPQQRFVLKRLKNRTRLGRFRQEVEAIQALSHPAVIGIIDFDLEGERPFFVSPYYVGGSLADTPERFEADVAAALQSLVDLCDGLATAHEAGITHRDLKPANVLVNEDGRLVIADFGICYIEDGERHTLTDEAVGAARFIAPELEDGRADDVSPRSDVYSLGKLVYWMLSGGTVFAREGHREPARDLSASLDGRHAEHVHRLLDRMIVLDPSGRFEDAKAVQKQAMEALRLVQQDYRVAGDPNQVCTFCGLGHYRMVVRGSSTEVNNFGLKAVGSNEFRILVCDECGHVQFFRADLGTRGELWDKKG